MKILILGGTIFLGRHVVESALKRGHELTLFNRGKHNPDLFPELEKIKGDRDKDIGLLKNRKWDVVIDTCGYFPRSVKVSAESLKDSIEHYIFISSVSVYSDFKMVGIDENYSVGKLDDYNIDKVDGETYGPLKARCENVLEEILPGRVCNIRPGLIVGPYDPTDRFTYWVRRVAEGGSVLAPGNPDSPVQFIDVRDLADWIINVSEKRIAGVFNATGPDYELSMKEFLESCKKVSSSDAEFEWVSEEFLSQTKVAPWSELPMWLPVDTDDENKGFQKIDISKAVSSGLKFRPIEGTIRDMLGWDKSRSKDYKLRAGMSKEREEEILESWTKIKSQ